ncbi:serine hydrolase domain-containing protein [Phaeobacter sp. C3_T13_0]|uniref:serine hydrolase domain-containing protein n=1 Tax=Phaeobacter cretensis TaxID=3342641 RepID=UPI0039BD12F8
MSEARPSLFAATFSLLMCLYGSSVWGQSMEEKLSAAIHANEIAGLHATVVMLDGGRISEAYFAGEDERWGMPIGIVDHGPETLHDVRSVTKSVVGLLYGIALADGLVPPLDTPLLDLFPEYSDLRDGTAREAITVQDALTMQMGTQWDESLPYSNPRNSEIAMEMASDRYRFVLDRPMVSEPGKIWTYNGGAVALIGKLIADGTKMEIDQFAEARLFHTLGITNYEWVRGGDGVPSAASGLRLTARDLAAIGVMVSQDGKYDGRQIVPAAWLEASFRPEANIIDGFNYGLLWYVASGPSGDPILIAQGNGGQRLTIQPKARFVVATFAGNYNQPGAWEMPLQVLLDYAVPEAGRHQSE